ncbi:MAG: aminodeoxychorismate/anthranilate synthase component II [Bacteroidota bacterium]
MKVIIIDNYDSFTYNLVQYIEELLGYEIDVYRNDEISLEEVGKYDVIFISPGPGIPSESGITMEVIKQYGPSKYIFGVCLGLQAITEVYGGSIYNLDTVFHGVSTQVKVVDEQDVIFKDLPEQFVAGRYHSWAAKAEDLPESLKVTATDMDGSIMALSHIEYNVFGVQFHPESIMTEVGKDILRNFLVHAKLIREEIKGEVQ